MKTNLLKRLIPLFATAVIGQAVFLPTAHAAALECSVLPASFCSSATEDNPKKSVVFTLLEWVLGIMSAGVGIVAVAAFVYAGIMYSSASNKPDQVKKAKDIMTQTVIGLVVFAIMALVIQWLVPGGVF